MASTTAKTYKSTMDIVIGKVAGAAPTGCAALHAQVAAVGFLDRLAARCTGIACAKVRP